MPRFNNVSCSQCGHDFGPGDSGFSSCTEHTQSGANEARLKRITHLEMLLRPIRSTGQRISRWGMYRKRRHEVYVALPFMDDEEAARAKAWLEQWTYQAE